MSWEEKKEHFHVLSKDGRELGYCIRVDDQWWGAIDGMCFDRPSKSLRACKQAVRASLRRGGYLK